MANEIAELPPIPAQDTPDGRALAVMAAKARALATSDIIPEHYRGKPGNIIVAMEMAQRFGPDVSPLMVMQNTFVVKGKLGFNAQFVIAMMNRSNKFIGGVRFTFNGSGEGRSCTAWANLAPDGERVERTVSFAEAKKAGWLDGYGWKANSDQMLAYRSGTYLGRLYAPETMLGITTVEELRDIHEAPEPRVSVEQREALDAKAEAILALQEGKPVEPEPATEAIDVQPETETKGPEATCGQTHYEPEGEPVFGGEEHDAAPEAVSLPDLHRLVMSASQGITNDGKKKAAADAFCPEIPKGVRWGEYVKGLGAGDSGRLLEELRKIGGAS